MEENYIGQVVELRILTDPEHTSITTTTTTTSSTSPLGKIPWYDFVIIFGFVAIAVVVVILLNRSCK